ncbi:hypothetical protein ES708_27706 [subsurface metagenome]
MTEEQKARLAELRKIPPYEHTSQEVTERLRLERLEDLELLAELRKEKQ